MITFPNAKINLGLAVTARRPDGYHDLQTVFYPLAEVCDALELVRRSEPGITLHQSGLAVDAPAADNLVCRAFELLRADYDLPGVDVWLNKQIPFGAGMGGGSADAAFMLRMLNDEFALGLSLEQLEGYAARLGADCPFFCRNTPVYAEGTGNLFSPVALSLSGMWIVVVKPPFGVSTREAFGGIVPRAMLSEAARAELCDVREVVETMPVGAWRGRLVNDFETTVFRHHPRLALIKEELYARGALYASMSGSGSTIFGIFDREPQLDGAFEGDYVKVVFNS
jgi:4-diphosphocytidyl-2-C-methyl-D-erythritol kinase